jgi:hypothetical protein
MDEATANIDNKTDETLFRSKIMNPRLYEE